MKDLLKTTAALILFIVAAITALTVVRNFNRRPSVILTSTECSPPCWYNIYPGQTTSSKVYSILDQFTGVNKDTILGEYNRSEKLIKIFWYFQWPAEDGMGSVNIDDQDRVTAINISTLNALKLGDLLNKLGEPELYWTGIGQRDDGEQYLKIVLLSPAQGYAAEMVVDIRAGATQVGIKDSTPVFRVTYFSPEMYQELLQTKILIEQSPSRRPPLKTWPGLGEISIPK
jgi:hypothetical protein